MARCLIIGCGCRGRELGRALIGEGFSVRGTTRDPARAEEMRRDGIEPWLGDPDRVGTLVGALGQVAVMVVMLGSAAGDPHALHGPRLQMLLTKVVDTGVRGVVYERSGALTEAVLASGAEIVRTACEGSRIPYALVDDGKLREAVLSLVH